MSETALDETFPANFRVERIASDTGLETFDHAFPKGWTGGGARHGVAVRVRPEGGRPWTGVFQPGGVYHVHDLRSMPGGETLAVVSDGQLFIVDVRQPPNCERAVARYVRSVVSVPAANVIVCSDATALVAFGPNGQAWQRAHFSREDIIEFQSVRGSILIGRHWDPALPGGGGWSAFAIDAATGRDSP